MKIKELIDALNAYDPDTEVVIEGYKANEETDNKSYDLVHVDGSIDGNQKVNVILWAMLKED